MHNFIFYIGLAVIDSVFCLLLFGGSTGGVQFKQTLIKRNNALGVILFHTVQDFIYVIRCIVKAF